MADDSTEHKRFVPTAGARTTAPHHQLHHFILCTTTATCTSTTPHTPTLARTKEPTCISYSHDHIRDLEADDGLHRTTPSRDRWLVVRACDDCQRGYHATRISASDTAPTASAQGSQPPSSFPHSFPQPTRRVLACTMASIEDLIASLGGNMHVSQDEYDLKALQEYLAQHLAMQPIAPMSPAAHFHAMPGSRSTSRTRKPTSLPSTYPYSDAPNAAHAHAHAHAHALPLPTPLAHAMYQAEHEEAPMFSPRPGALRRTSSYGFGTPTGGGLSGFESDAFAPLAFGAGPSKPPAASNPWAAFQKTPTQLQVQVQVQEVRRPDDPAQDTEEGDGYGGQEDEQDEDERMMMDEDEAEESMMDQDEEEERVERVMGIGNEEPPSWGYDEVFRDGGRMG